MDFYKSNPVNFCLERGKRASVSVGGCLGLKTIFTFRATTVYKMAAGGAPSAYQLWAPLTMLPGTLRIPCRWHKKAGGWVGPWHPTGVMNRGVGRGAWREVLTPQHLGGTRGESEGPQNSLSHERPFTSKTPGPSTEGVYSVSPGSPSRAEELTVKTVPSRHLCRSGHTTGRTRSPPPLPPVCQLPWVCTAFILM